MTGKLAERTAGKLAERTAGKLAERTAGKAADRLPGKAAVKPAGKRAAGERREYKIGRLAELADCQVVTIRYYEKEGLLGKPARTDNGYRLYHYGDLERLRFIRHCRDHGITLADIKLLLKLREAPEGDCRPVDDIIDGIIARLEEQIRSSRRLRRNLVGLKNLCRGGTIGECEILRSLSDRDSCACADPKEAADQDRRGHHDRRDPLEAAGAAPAAGSAAP